MAEYFELIQAVTCMRQSVFTLLSCIVTRNISDDILFLMMEEEEDDELIYYFLKIIETNNFLIPILLHQGNTYPPPKQDTILFPEFVSSNFPGNDLVADLIPRPWLLYDMTGETVQSFLSIVRDLTPTLESVTMEGHDRQRYQPTKLSISNRILLVMIWLWRYKTGSELSALFLVSPTVVERNIKLIVPILRKYFENFIRWPSDAEWGQKIGHWENFPNAVGVIDGTLHEIYRPITDPQELYYSGRVKYHCFSTQIVVDNVGNIVFVQCGFLGHLNDAGQWQHILPPIGQNMPLSIPANVYLMADKGYPNEEPLLTPWRHQRLRGHPERTFFNREFSRHRESVEHAIKRLKEYKAVSSLWRNERVDAQTVMEVCAQLAQRHIVLTREIR